jgi:alpha-amylase/alpha-mannosidase (GH57 family)
VTHSVAIHGHFYQPPRENPFTGEMPREEGAEPYHDFNEKITAECYRPNAAAGNLDRMSFNIGPTLISWLDRHDHETYRRIQEADRCGAGRLTGSGNAIAQSAHHTILPLARRRDKITQIKWGIASFIQRFGRQPRGMWLPELAVDLTTLEILSRRGLSFTILSEEQVQGEVRGDAGPYRVRLPDGGFFAVFVRDRQLSNQLSFDADRMADGRTWLAEQVQARPGLTLIATDGETFGHHQQRGVQLLSEILRAEAEAPYQIVTLADYVRTHPPTREIEIVERTAWSCSHHLARWDKGCGCTPGDHSWKPVLRSALDLLADEIDAIYLYELRRLFSRPWLLVDQYIDVVLGVADMGMLIRENTAAKLTTGQQLRIGKLVQAQLHRQRMFTSCGWFFEKLDRPEPRYVIAQAMRAIQLVREATGTDLGPDFREALCAARCGKGKPLPGLPPLTAANLYDAIAAANQIA